jgi:hydroxymethylbilane synthase
VLPREIFLSAGGQGIIAMQIRADEKRVRTIVGLVNDRETLLCLRAEREFLRLLHGDCNSPVGVLANIDNGKLRLRAQVFDQKSIGPREGKVEGGLEDGEVLAAHLFRRINGE